MSSKKNGHQNGQGNGKVVIKDTTPASVNLSNVLVTMKDKVLDTLMAIARKETSKSPHLKHFVRIIEDTLSRAKPGVKLVIGFDDEKAFKAMITELEVNFAGPDAGFINDAYHALDKICRHALIRNKEKGSVNLTPWERAVVEAVQKLIKLFWETWSGDGLERFHSEKITWLEYLNKELVTFQPISIPTEKKEKKEELVNA